MEDANTDLGAVRLEGENKVLFFVKLNDCFLEGTSLLFFLVSLLRGLLGLLRSDKTLT